MSYKSLFIIHFSLFLKGLGQPLVIKQEKDSDSGWRCTEGSIVVNQEKSPSVLDSKKNVCALLFY